MIAECGPKGSPAIQTMVAGVREMKSVLREHRARLGRCLALLERVSADQGAIIDLLSVLIDERRAPTKSGGDSSADR